MLVKLDHETPGIRGEHKKMFKKTTNLSGLGTPMNEDFSTNSNPFFKVQNPQVLKNPGCSATISIPGADNY